jgi:hypothetical protein
MGAQRGRPARGKKVNLPFASFFAVRLGGGGAAKACQAEVARTSSRNAAERPRKMGGILVAEGIGDIDDFQVRIGEHLCSRLEPRIFHDLGIGHASVRKRPLQCSHRSAHDRGGAVASRAPLDILKARVIELLVGEGVTVICAGGGGIPVTERTLRWRRMPIWHLAY